MADVRHKSAQFRSRNPMGWEGRSNPLFDEQGASRLPGPVGSTVTPTARASMCASFTYQPDLGPSYEMYDAPSVCVMTKVCSMRPEAMRVLAWLRQYQEKIANAERRFEVDRRAIAGAIAWEAIENRHLKNRSFLRTSVGKGKVHVRHFSHGMPSIFSEGEFVAKQVEDRGYLPKPTSSADRMATLATNEGAITYIAAIMRAGADTAAKYGFDIYCDPPLLTQFYQSNDLDTWEAHLKSKPKGSPLVAAETMAVWVQANLDYLEDGVGLSELANCQQSSASSGVRQ